MYAFISDCIGLCEKFNLNGEYDFNEVARNGGKLIHFILEFKTRQHLRLLLVLGAFFSGHCSASR